MRRQPGLLEKLRQADIDAWIQSNRDDAKGMYMPSKGFADLDRKTISRMVDEDLSELAAQQTRTKLGHLAASELRRREAWRGPARWSLVIAAIAVTVSIISMVVAVGAG